MMISNRVLSKGGTVFSLVLCVSITGAVSAKSYPNKAIRLIVARILGQELSAGFGQPVAIDNRRGAA